MQAFVHHARPHMRPFGFIALSLLSAAAFAQAPPAPPAPAAPAAADPLTGNATLGYLATNGNTESKNSNASFKADWDRGGNWVHGWTGQFINARTDGIKTAESYAAGYKGQRDFSETSYFFAAADWRKDRFSGYEDQMSETVGYGRRLIDNDRHMLAVEGGAGFKQSTLADGTDVDDTIVRGGLNYLLHISETSEFEQKLITEIGSENTYTESVTALRARIIGELAIVLSYTIKNNSDVPAGIDETDTFTAISVEYAF
jgi:putative salt-induced outer membrane protein